MVPLQTIMGSHINEPPYFRGYYQFMVVHPTSQKYGKVFPFLPKATYSPPPPTIDTSK